MYNADRSVNAPGDTMETYVQNVLMIIVAMLALFMGSIRFLLNRKVFNSAKEVNVTTLSGYE
jgi:hypothetical protein